MPFIMRTAELLPIFHLGWIIQPTLEGFEVYQRLDTLNLHSYFFEYIEEALNYIHTVIRFGRR